MARSHPLSPLTHSTRVHTYTCPLTQMLIAHTHTHACTTHTHMHHPYHMCTHTCAHTTHAHARTHHTQACTTRTIRAHIHVHTHTHAHTTCHTLHTRLYHTHTPGTSKGSKENASNQILTRGFHQVAPSSSALTGGVKTKLRGWQAEERGKGKLRRR